MIGKMIFSKMEEGQKSRHGDRETGIQCNLRGRMQPDRIERE